MSQNNAIAFLEKTAADASLAEEVNGLSPAQTVALAAAAGFIFTEEELSAARSSELSDEDLEQAAGGTNTGSYRYESKNRGPL